MGVDIGVYVYDKEREDRIRALAAVLKHSSIYYNIPKEYWPFDVAKAKADLKSLGHERINARVKASGDLNGERWFNLIFNDGWIGFEFSPGHGVYAPDDIKALIGKYERIIRMYAGDTSQNLSYVHLEYIIKFLKHVNEHDYMIAPA